MVLKDANMELYGSEKDAEHQIFFKCASEENLQESLKI